MTIRAFALAVTLLLLPLITQQTAEAKTPGYIITGGELGSSAAYVDGFVLDEENPLLIFLPGEDSWPVASPPEGTSIVYDVWQQIGYMDVVPLFEFYPDVGVLRLKRSGDWYQAGPSTLAFLERALEYATTMKSAGLLENNVHAAQLRAIRLPHATFSVRPYAIPGEGYDVAGNGQCPRCVSFSGARDDFVMGHLVAVLQGPLVGPAPDMPPYAIEFEILEPPSGKVAGLLGMYRPPEADEPGQFWLEHYSRESQYYETTPGFDTVLAGALNDMPPRLRNPAATDSLAGESWDSLPSWMWLGTGAAIALAMLFGATIHVLVRREN